MAEQITTTIPASLVSLRVVKVHLNMDSESIFIELNGGGVSRNFSYRGEEAVTMMTALNKANLSIKSLQRRIIERLISDGKLDGIIDGTPD
jgi:hypothetical protein